MLSIPLCFSVGAFDHVAPPGVVKNLATALRPAGAKHVEVSVYRGGHRLDPSELERALRWFEARAAAERPSDLPPPGD